MRRSNKPRESTDRRSFIKYAGATGVAGLAAFAGCTSNNSGSGEATGNGGGAGSGNNSTNGGTAAGSGGGSGKKVVIGSNHPLSGSLASTGKSMHNAVKLAAARKNDAGGISSLDGAKVKVVKGDNQGKQELGGEVTQNLIDKGAKTVLGCYASPVTTAAAQVAERKQTPFVITIAAATDILQGRGFNYIYRPQPPAQQIAKDYADLVPEVIRQNGSKIESAGLFYVNNSYGQSFKKNLGEFLPKNDVEVVTETAIDVGGSSANTQVTKLKQADPDAVIATTYVPEGVTLVEAMQNQGYRPPHLTASASATFTNADAVKDIGSFANGIMDNNYSLDPTNPKTEKVRKQYNKQYSQTLNASDGMAYIAAEVAIAAIEKAGSTDREAINEALQEITVKDHIGAMGPITFKKNGENKNSLAPINQVQDKSIKVVYPEKYAEAKPTVKTASK